jgi:hypothetical protein
MLNYDSGGSKEARRPPLVRGLPFFGNTFQFLRDTSRLLNDSYRRYGPVFRLRALWLKYTVIAGFEARDFLPSKSEDPDFRLSEVCRAVLESDSGERRESGGGSWYGDRVSQPLTRAVHGWLTRGR